MAFFQLSSEACGGATPACDDANACRACRAHAECAASDACLSDGSCADPLDVAHVDPMGSDDTTCGRSTPCARIAAALATGNRYIRIHGVLDEAVVVSGGRSVTILGELGATLSHRTGAGSVLTVRDDGTSLAIPTA